jgi:hypothetical protein
MLLLPDIHANHQTECEQKETHYRQQPNVPTTQLATNRTKRTKEQDEQLIDTYSYYGMMNGSVYLPPPITDTDVTYRDLLDNNDGVLPFADKMLLQYPPHFLHNIDPDTPSKYHHNFEGWNVVDNTGPMFDIETHKFIAFNYKHHPTVLANNDEWVQHLMKADPYVSGGLGDAVYRGGVFKKQSAEQYPFVIDWEKLVFDITKMYVWY